MEQFDNCIGNRNNNINYFFGKEGLEENIENLSAADAPILIYINYFEE